MGKDTYGEMNKKTAGMSAFDKISYFNDVMSSPEFKAHTQELMKTAQEQKAKAEGKKSVEGENGNTAIKENIKQEAVNSDNAEVKADNGIEPDNTINNDAVISNEGNINNNVNSSENIPKDNTASVNENISENKSINDNVDIKNNIEDKENESSETITDKQNSFDNNEILTNEGSNGIDTDNVLSENNQINNDTADNAETVNQVSDMGINAESNTDESVIKKEGQNDVVNGENGIANGDGMGYKGEEGNILKTKNIPKLTNATDYNNYVAEIAKRQDITKDEKVRHIQEAYKLTENKTDINCPIDAKYVKNITNQGIILYDFPKFLGFIKNNIHSITKENSLPKIWERIGSLKGSYFTSLSEDGQSYTSEERSVPYIKNSDAEHNGNFKTEHYFDIIDAIRKGDIETLNSIRQKQGKSKLDTTDLIYYQEKYNQYIEWVKSEGIDIDATYGLQGYAAPWKINGKISLKGGAPQFVTPFTGQILYDLGLLEIKK